MRSETNWYALIDIILALKTKNWSWLIIDYQIFFKSTIRDKEIIDVKQLNTENHKHLHKNKMITHQNNDYSVSTIFLLRDNCLIEVHSSSTFTINFVKDENVKSLICLFSEVESNLNRNVRIVNNDAEKLIAYLRKQK